MSITDTSATAATWGETALSLRALLANLHRYRRLQPLLRHALVERYLLDQAKAAGLTVSSEELQRGADLFRRRHGLNSAQRTQDWLGAQHWSAIDLEEAAEHDLLIAKFKDHLFKDKVAAHFEANRASYDSAVLRAIAVGREDLAKELLSQLRDEGRDFAAIALEHSQHPSRLIGGMLGPVRRQQLAEAVGQAVFAARPGDIIGPLRTAAGFELLRIESIQPAQLAPPTAALIRQQLFDAWLAARLKEVPMTLPLLDQLDAS